MTCSQCGREIADGSLSCNYCGKIFVNKRPVGGRMVDANNFEAETKIVGSPVRPKEVASPVQQPAPKTELAQAVALRRYQRWGFYALISVLFIFAIFYIVKISNDNTNLINELTNTKTVVSSKEAEINNKVEEIKNRKLEADQKSSSLSEMSSNLAKTSDALTRLQADNLKAINDLKAKSDEFDQLKQNAFKNEAVVKNLVNELGVNINLAALNKITYAELGDMPGIDTDKDGIPDSLEAAFGTDSNKFDTDGDGYSDKDEINKGYNPSGTGKIQADEKITKLYKGKVVLLKANNDTYAWYVALNGKRYFLGMASNNYNDILSSSYWVK